MTNQQILKKASLIILSSILDSMLDCIRNSSIILDLMYKILIQSLKVIFKTIIFNKLIVPFFKILIWLTYGFITDIYYAVVLKKDISKNILSFSIKASIASVMMWFMIVQPFAYAATNIRQIVKPISDSQLKDFNNQLKNTSNQMTNSKKSTNKIMPNGDYAPEGINVIKMKDDNGKIFIGIDKLFSHPSNEKQIILNKYVVDVQKAAHTYNVNPSVMLAQAMVESGWGKSQLAIQGNNFFGIKGKGDSGSIKLPTGEETKSGKQYMIDSDFAKYHTVKDGMSANGDLLRNPQKRGLSKYRYSMTWIENTTSYKDATLALKQAGYATDLQYTETLNSFIEKYGLYVMDNHDVHNHDLVDSEK